MADRPDDAQDEASKKASGGIVNSLFRSRIARVNSMDAKGLAASSIGIVLAASIGLGYAIGSWLDTRFGTTFWTPVMLLMGIGAGFREIFHIIKPILRQSKLEQAERARKREVDPVSGGYAKPKGAPTSPEEYAPEKPSTEERGRSFRIPAPPASSFDARKPASTEAVTPDSPEDVDDISTLTERLLKENDDRTSSL